MPPEESVVLVDGPWSHREVTAGGLRIHLAEAGPQDGPLVLLLHGFPEFWWSWRAQLVALLLHSSQSILEFLQAILAALTIASGGLGVALTLAFT